MLHRCKILFCSTLGIQNKRQITVGTVFRSTNSYCKKKSHNCGEIREENAGLKVSLCGWLQHKRLSGLFITLRDAHGVTQVVLPEEKDQEVIQSLPAESVIQVIGTVGLRPASDRNPKMPTGGIEVKADEIKVLNSCRKDLPFHIQDRQKVGETLRLEYRYLDIRNSYLQHNLRLRSQFIMKMRDFLCNQNGFIDVETPLLFRKTPGGAREFKVPTHMSGKFYSLPQSPQQFKQLLMAGSIDRYMQIAKCFRDESGKPDRQPEFTQVDLEMSFVDKDDIQDIVEALLRCSWPEGRPSIETPFLRMKYKDAIANYGSDKPDTRFDMQLCDITDLVKDCKIEKVSNAAKQMSTCSVQTVNFKEAGSHLSKKDIESVNTILKEIYTDVWFAVVRVKNDGAWQGGLHRQFGEDVYRLLCEKLNSQPGDLIVFTAGKHTNACTCAGRFRTEVAKLLELNGKNMRGNERKMNFLWVEDFPLFLPKEEGSGVESAHHPFTAPHPEEEELVYTNPEQVRSLHYDLVLNGNEVGGGSVRIHNAALQRYILTNVLKEDTSSLEHLLTALELGCPPHGGIALGLDRLVAIICNAPSIKDVIAFPKTSEGNDLMVKAPATISAEDKSYYHL